VSAERNDASSRSVQADLRNARAELRAWYLASLRPKLVRAGSTGIVPPSAASALDRQLGELLDLDAGAGEEAA
jgi:hypothetical protein